jgi:hypothetical protein
MNFNFNFHSEIMLHSEKEREREKRDDSLERNMLHSKKKKIYIIYYVSIYCNSK